jgi:hypothetical protein
VNAFDFCLDLAIAGQNATINWLWHRTTNNLPGCTVYNNNSMLESVQAQIPIIIFTTDATPQKNREVIKRYFLKSTSKRPADN